MTKINWYFFIQIIKSCILVFFIFTSIGWLLQISRLFSYLNNLQIDFYKIIYLSTFIIPNLIIIILPFVIIFFFFLTFIKLDKDKEIIALFSLGLGTKELVKPIILVSIIMVIVQLFLNLFISPIFYEKYKKKENNLRNIININDINFSNFIELDKNLIIDFEKENENFIDILINYKDDKGDNFIFAKNGEIYKDKGFYIFNLNNGYRINVNIEEIEKLEFKKYKIKFKDEKDIKYNNYDENALTIFDLIKENNIITIQERIFDTLLFISLIIFFHLYIIKKNNYAFKNITIYLILTITILIIHNLIKNIDINIENLTSLYSINLSLFYIYLIIEKKLYEKN